MTFNPLTFDPEATPGAVFEAMRKQAKGDVIEALSDVVAIRRRAAYIGQAEHELARLTYEHEAATAKVEAAHDAMREAQATAREAELQRRAVPTLEARRARQHATKAKEAADAAVSAYGAAINAKVGYHAAIENMRRRLETLEAIEPKAQSDVINLLRLE